jgi:Arc/MetJ family transcription regulator
MRTTLDLNEILLNEAMKWTGILTKTAVINEALREIIDQKKRMRLIEMAGNVKLDVDLNITRAKK